jgi:alpha-tubulin suppressor-like RCC1 family protein
MPERTVRCWGENQNGQLGNASRALATEDFLTCAVRDDGAVLCWGRTSDLTGREQWLVPTPVAGLADVAELALGANQRCARTRSGRVLCWGERMSEQATGGYTTVDPPAEEPRAAGATRIRAAGYLMCAQLAGRYRCWGADVGQIDPLGGAAGMAHTPRELAIPDADELASGMNFLCAHTRGDAVVCQGSSANGEGGDGAQDRDAPTRVRWP